VPFSGGHGEAVLRNAFAGALDAFADLRPVGAGVFLDLAHQVRALILRQRPQIGAAHRCRGDRDLGADIEQHADSQLTAALSEVDHAETIARADGDRASGLAHQLIAIRIRHMAYAHVGERGISERHRGRCKLVLFETRNGREITEFRQRVGEPRNRRLRQIRSRCDFLISQKAIAWTECAQHIEPSRQRDNKTAIRRRFLRRAFHSSNRICGLR